MTPHLHAVLVAAELRPLVEPDPLPGGRITWISANESIPPGDFDAIVPILSRRVGRDQLALLPRLRVIANCAVGFDNIDVIAASERGIIVTNTPDVLTEATADLTWALILAVGRRLREGLQLIEQGRWAGWDPTGLLGLEMRGATLGIVGAGRIGQAVARRGLGFGMRLIYSNPSARPEFERATGATRCDVNALFATSDVVSVHVPSGPATRQMIDSAALRSMQPHSILINTSRGDLVDEGALIRALERGELAGAGLDVFEDEPRVPAALMRHPRVVVLPHIGSATTVTRRAMAALALRNVAEVLAGRAPVSPVV